MLKIDLAPVPNQEFTVTLEGQPFTVVIKEANGVMVATVSRGEVTLISNSRIMPFGPIIPYPYLETGNLAITTENDEIPYYTAFGATQFLYYVTEEEVGQLRG